MKSFVLSLLFAFAFTLPGSAESVEGEVFRIIPLNAGIKEGLQANNGWEACGDYFVAAKTTVGKIIHFNYEVELPDGVPVFAFYQIGQIVPRIDDKLAAPIVVISSPQIRIWMNGKDFKASLPCLANDGR